MFDSMYILFTGHTLSEHIISTVEELFICGVNRGAPGGGAPHQLEMGGRAPPPPISLKWGSALTSRVINSVLLIIKIIIGFSG